jgi:hypothetical protein
MATGPARSCANMTLPAAIGARASIAIDRVLRGGQDFSGTRNVCCEDQRLNDLRVELRARAPAKFFDRLGI